MSTRGIVVHSTSEDEALRRAARVYADAKVRIETDRAVQRARTGQDFPEPLAVAS